MSILMVHRKVMLHKTALGLSLLWGLHINVSCTQHFWDAPSNFMRIRISVCVWLQLAVCKVGVLKLGKLHCMQPVILVGKIVKQYFLNQTRIGQRLACAWFLIIASVHKYLYVYVCVCLCV